MLKGLLKLCEDMRDVAAIAGACLRRKVRLKHYGDRVNLSRTDESAFYIGQDEYTQVWEAYTRIFSFQYPKGTRSRPRPLELVKVAVDDPRLWTVESWGKAVASMGGELVEPARADLVVCGGDPDAVRARWTGGRRHRTPMFAPEDLVIGQVVPARIRDRAVGTEAGAILLKLRKLFRSPEREQQRQGIEIAAALEERVLLESLLAGTEVEEQQLKPSMAVRQLPPELLFALAQLLPEDHALRCALAATEAIRLELEDLSCLSFFTGLRELHLEGTLTNLEGLPPCSALEILDLTGLGSLDSLAGVGAAPNLTRLDLNGLVYLQDLDGVEALTKLRWVRASYANLERIDALAGCSELESADFACCNLLADISALAGKTALREINLLATAIEDGQALAGLPALENLQVDSPIAAWLARRAVAAPP